MSINFVIVEKKIIYLDEIDIIFILLVDRKSIKLLDIALVLECNSNLISLGQLHKTGITFYNNSSHMTLIRHGVIIAKDKWY